MIEYQTFRNTDPPVIAQLWRSRAGQRGLLSNVSPDLFEQLVFAKLFFDPRGLIIAREHGRPVGFVHAGFGPNASGDGVDPARGTTALLLVDPDCDAPAVAGGLLTCSEHYLKKCGARDIYGGAVRPFCPFYLGLYGGAELPGVFDGDQVAHDAYIASGYEQVERTMAMQLDLGRFQPTIDRRQMQVRRQMIVEVTSDPPPQSWWEACAYVEFEMVRFDVVPKGGGSTVAWAVFRHVEPLGATGYARAAAMVDIWVEATMRQRGVALFLFSEACRHFLRQGITVVEAQISDHNPAAGALLSRLGFEQTGGGRVYLRS